jgi:hypothetical protein
VHERRRSFLNGIQPTQNLSGKQITGWLGVSEPKGTDYHREIISPAFSEEAVDTSIFDLLPMALPLPFNHGLPIGYAIIGKIVVEVMADGGKQMALCWGQAGTYDTEPQTSQGSWPLRAAALSCYWKLWLEALKKRSKVMKTRCGTSSPPKPWLAFPVAFAMTETSCP